MFEVRLTAQQLQNVKLFLKRVSLTGDEAFAYIELRHALEQAKEVDTKKSTK